MGLITTKNMKDHIVIKNNISYFESGMKAGMILAGIPKEEVERRFYMTTTYPCLMRDILSDYDAEKSHTDGLKRMLDNL